ncbi:MAG: hypothetical protein F7B61_00645 [Caldisphaeraceae archaeon]|nr:hypothetical protein [Caldisphaeraceae archaeon]
MVVQRLKITIYWYKRTTVSLNEVKFEVLRPVGKEEEETKGDPLNTLYKLGEEKLKKRKADFFIITIETPESRYVLGEGLKDRTTRLLYNMPTRLLKVGIIKMGKTKSGGEGYFILRDENIEWHDIKEEAYIYDGPLKVGEGIEAIVFETSIDRRVVRVQHPSRQRQASQSRDQQNQSSPDSGI